MLRVLVVDGDLDTAQTLATLLHAMNHEVQFAINTRAAREIAASFRPDIVVLDAAALEEAAGLLGALRAHRSGGAPRLWAVCRAGDADARRRALEAGCEHQLSKPVDAETFARLLQDAEPAP